MIITAIPLRRLGAGEGPILLAARVTCNNSHTKLSQCVHPNDIGIHNCNRNNTAGVVCPIPTISTNKSIVDVPSDISASLNSIVLYNPTITQNSETTKLQQAILASVIPYNPSVTHNYSKTSKLQTAILASVGSVLFLFIVAIAAVVLALVLWKKLKRR